MPTKPSRSPKSVSSVTIGTRVGAGSATFELAALRRFVLMVARSPRAAPGHRPPEPRARRENTEPCVGQCTGDDLAADRLSEADGRFRSLTRGLVEKASGLLGHAEAAVGQLLRDLLRRMAGEGELEV